MDEHRKPEPVYCDRCGRPLTTRRSRELGLGPTCQKKPKQ